MSKTSTGTRSSDHPSVSGDWVPPRAVLYDLDGTLYDQRPLRKAMVLELLRAPLTRGPVGAWRIARVLKSFRRLRETLRAEAEAARAAGTPLEGSLAELQYARPAEALGVSPSMVESIVEEWMFQKPLKHLPAAGWPNLRATFLSLKDAGLKLGVFSDYPPAAKLEALGVGDLMDVVLSATDPEVNAFKPDPKGFELGAERLGYAPSEVIYVGDRWDVDARGAEAAGMRSVILDTGLDHVGATEEFGDEIRALRNSNHCRSVQRFKEVRDALGIC